MAVDRMLSLSPSLDGYVTVMQAIAEMIVMSAKTTSSSINVKPRLERIPWTEQELDQCLPGFLRC